jgi:tetratricopeptide (TPR) repeat protein
MPTMKQNLSYKANQEIITYSEQIAARESEIDLLNRELEAYKAEKEATEEQKAIAMATKSSYEDLIKAMQTYSQESYNRTNLVDDLLKIQTEPLGEVGMAMYTTISSVVFEEECSWLYDYAQKNFEVKNYNITIERMERVMKIDKEYADGGAMLLLMQAYHDTNEAAKAEELYNQILEKFPDTEVSRTATQIIKGITD